MLVGEEVPPEADRPKPGRDRVDRRAERDGRPDRVERELEGNHHSKIAATAPERPEEVRVLVGARRQQPAVRDYDFGRDEVVDAEPVAAPQPADAAREREPRDTGVGDQPAGCGEPVRLRCLVDVAPYRAALDARRGGPPGRRAPCASSRGRSSGRRRPRRGPQRCGRRPSPRPPAHGDGRNGPPRPRPRRRRTARWRMACGRSWHSRRPGPHGSRYPPQSGRHREWWCAGPRRARLRALCPGSRWVSLWWHGKESTAGRPRASVAELPEQGHNGHRRLGSRA